MSFYEQKQVEYNQLKQGQGLSHLYRGLQGKARKNFIKKVYAVLTGQLLITLIFCLFAYNFPSFLDFQIANPALMWVSLALMIVIEIFMLCFDFGRRFPVNMILLLLFTLTQSYLVSYIVSIVGQNQGGQIVVIAALMTLSIFLALTVYAIFTKKDFTVKWGMIIVIFTTLITLSFISIFSHSLFWHNLLCALGVILFGLYIVIDTQMIVGNKKYKLGLDDYAVGALILYIDIIGIFLYLVQLLTNSR